MAYDDELAHRIRAILSGEPKISEKAMFGGLAFLTEGRMAVAANRRGGLMARIDPQECEQLTREHGVERMVMGGRTMNGWLAVEPGVIEDDERLAEWVRRGLTFARTQPAKG